MITPSHTNAFASADEALISNGHKIHVVHDEQSVLHPAHVPGLDPTGAEVLVSMGRPVNADQLVFQILRLGGMEDIRLDERANLALGNTFVLAVSDRLFPFTLNDKQYKWPHPRISGAVLRRLAGVDALHEIELRRDGVAVAIGSTDLVDLSLPGIEHFKTVDKPHRWEIKVQGVPVFSESPTIEVRVAMTKAGFDVRKAWDIFLIIDGAHGQPKKSSLTLDSVVDLRAPGIEKIRLMPHNVGNGDGQAKTMRREFKLLPVDKKYLDGLGNNWETVKVGERRWLVIHDYQVPAGFKPGTVDLALDIPKDYPAAQIDMFYFAPFVCLAHGGEIPSTQVRETIDGVTFQGWSRHRNAPSAWDPSTDNVVTHIALVESCMGKELGE